METNFWEKEEIEGDRRRLAFSRKEMKFC